MNTGAHWSGVEPTQMSWWYCECGASLNSRNWRDHVCIPRTEPTNAPPEQPHTAAGETT